MKTIAELIIRRIIIAISYVGACISITPFFTINCDLDALGTISCIAACMFTGFIISKQKRKTRILAERIRTSKAAKSAVTVSGIAA